MTLTSLETVNSSLTDDAGQHFLVRLRLTVKRLPDSDVRDVSEHELIGGMVPDGTYTIEYFFFKQYRLRVSVQYGVLRAA